MKKFLALLFLFKFVGCFPAPAQSPPCNWCRINSVDVSTPANPKFYFLQEPGKLYYNIYGHETAHPEYPDVQYAFGKAGDTYLTGSVGSGYDYVLQVNKMKPGTEYSMKIIALPGACETRFQFVTPTISIGVVQSFLNLFRKKKR